MFFKKNLVVEGFKEKSAFKLLLLYLYGTYRYTLLYLWVKEEASP